MVTPVPDEVVDLDATDPGYKADPYPLYAALRTSAPVRRVTLNTMPAWLVTRSTTALGSLPASRAAPNAARTGAHRFPVWRCCVGDY